MWRLHRTDADSVCYPYRLAKISAGWLQMLFPEGFKICHVKGNYSRHLPTTVVLHFIWNCTIHYSIVTGHIFLSYCTPISAIWNESPSSDQIAMVQVYDPHVLIIPVYSIKKKGFSIYIQTSMISRSPAWQIPMQDKHWRISAEYVGSCNKLSSTKSSLEKYQSILTTIPAFTI